MIIMINRLRKAQGGFTLIELLVVVAIIALLATFAVPKLFDAINKSKKAPGQADMQTIASALERYYMDNNTYPFANVDTALKTGYLKTTTTFLNGFKQPYLYGTTSAGAGYILIDLQGTAVTGNSVTITCGAGNTYNFSVPASPTGLSVNAAIDPNHLANCTAPTGAALDRN